MKPIGEQVKALRTTYRIHQDDVAKLAGVGVGVVHCVERGSPVHAEAVLQAALALSQTKEADRYLLLHPDRPSDRCRNSACGAVLYSSEDKIPKGWIVTWHLDCGGYCAACAVALNLGDLQRARKLLQMEKYLYG